MISVFCVFALHKRLWSHCCSIRLCVMPTKGDNYSYNNYRPANGVTFPLCWSDIFWLPSISSSHSVEHYTQHTLYHQSLIHTSCDQIQSQSQLLVFETKRVLSSGKFWWEIPAVRRIDPRDAITLWFERNLYWWRNGRLLIKRCASG